MHEELVLYTNPRSRGCIARWMLEETQLPYRTEMLDFGEAMKKPDYLALNPMGKVPTLVHGKAVVTEAAAICAYLSLTFPQTDLGPQNNQECASFFRWLFFTAGPLESAVSAKAFGWELPHGKEMAAGFGSFETTISVLEEALAAGPYLTGSRFTGADVYVGVHVDWGLRFGTIPRRPAFEHYVKRLSERAAYRRQEALDAEAAGQMYGK